ncbi:MAG: nucleotidyltransferase family protein [Thermosipho sp. (in: Bacteria)]|nr:nucleotidyltransferase family protein [Thermosipho sp. (in: thermotogales)]
MEEISTSTGEKVIYSVILAAGEGKRYKNGNKLLHNIDGRPMLQIVIDLVKKCNFQKNYLIVNPSWKYIKNYFTIPDNFSIIENKNYKDGLSTSIKSAIKEINNSNNKLPDYIAIFLGDMPFIIKKDVETILAYCDGKNKIIAPFYNEKKGFPTFVHNSLFKNLMKIRGDQGIKQIINENPSLLKKIKLDTERVIKDIDQ